VTDVTGSSRRNMAGLRFPQALAHAAVVTGGATSMTTY
jgi:hypothetical protein